MPIGYGCQLRGIGHERLELLELDRVQPVEHSSEPLELAHLGELAIHYSLLRCDIIRAPGRRDQILDLYAALGAPPVDCYLACEGSALAPNLSLLFLGTFGVRGPYLSCDGSRGVTDTR